MKHHHYGLILLLCISCNENKSTATNENTQELKAVKKDFDPTKSKKYDQILISTLYQQSRDTFLIGDTLNARINFHENVEVLKHVAEYENLEYTMEYNADARSEDKSLVITPSDDNQNAEVKFIVTADSTNRFQKMDWRFAITFLFTENEKAVYDTTFVRSVP